MLICKLLRAKQVFCRYDDGTVFREEKVFVAGRAFAVQNVDAQGGVVEAEDGNLVFAIVVLFPVANDRDGNGFLELKNFFFKFHGGVMKCLVAQLESELSRGFIDMVVQINKCLLLSRKHICYRHKEFMFAGDDDAQGEFTEFSAACISDVKNRMTGEIVDTL